MHDRSHPHAMRGVRKAASLIGLPLKSRIHFHQGVHVQLVVATSNQGKLREITMIMEGVNVRPYTDFTARTEIEETGSTFQANAMIKSDAIYAAIGDEELIVIADDSGISVPALGGEPGVYSARYAGVGATDRENLHKLIDALKAADITRTPAYYTSAIAVSSRHGTFTTHGWMHGEVIDHARGDNGFGYDPMFIPTGHDKTLGELEDSVKKAFSHRSKALFLAHTLLKSLLRSD